jgi:CRP/FNR family transcriptional regulator, anaerobic regulatory protein
MEIAIQQYLNTYKMICPDITEAALEYVESRAVVVELEAKQHYFHVNTIHQELGFVYAGLVKAFYIDQACEEITVNFFKENSFVTHYTSFITQQPSKYTFQCIEPTIIVKLSYIDIQNGYQKYPVFEKYGRLVAEEVLKMQQKRIESFLFDDAEHRYLDFTEKNPDLFNRVSLSDLSTFLGIARPSLSRIRKKLAFK